MRNLLLAATAGLGAVVVLAFVTAGRAPEAPPVRADVDASRAAGAATTEPRAPEAGRHGHTAVDEHPGTRRMVERLRKLAAELEASGDHYFNGGRIANARRRAEGERGDSEAWFWARAELASELLVAGDSALAAEAFRSLDRDLKDSPEAEAILGRLGQEPKFPGRFAEAATDSLLDGALAVSMLRVGEQANCQERHTIDSCLLPIRGEGVHRLPAGSQAAREHLLSVLRAHPDDLSARWLLNLAAMTLGDYPDGVPPRFQVAPEVFASDRELPRFVDVAPRYGLDAMGLLGGSVVDDLDGDGDLDVLVSSYGLRDPIRLFRNDGQAGFSERTSEAGLGGLTGGLNLVQADYDNDGHVDVFVLRGGWHNKRGHHPNSLLKNTGDGRFVDATEEAGLLTFHPTQTATWLDYDGDGNLDLFVGNESTEEDLHPAELFHNRGDGTFEEVAARVGVAVTGYIKAVVSGDVDNDGRPDLYVSRLNGKNLLLHNDGPRAGTDGADAASAGWAFSDVTERAGVGEPVHSFPSWFFDYDNDGDLDLFVAGYRVVPVGDVLADYLDRPHGGELPRLYRNRGDGTFDEVSRQVGLDTLLLAMGVNFGDLDNDGYLDFYVGTGTPDYATLVPNRMFRNAAGKRFEDVTTSGGFGHLQKGHGISFGDIDGDGDQDVHAIMGGAYVGDRYMNALFENPGNGNHWIKLRLEGVRSNRGAIGARIEVVAAGPGGSRRLHRVVGSGGSFGANPLTVEIGLGDATEVVSVTIAWPGSGTRQQLGGLAVDAAYRVREPVAEEYALVPTKPTRSADDPGAHHHH